MVNTKIIFLGDMMLGDGFLSINRGIGSFIDKNNRLPLSKKIIDLLKQSDLAVANLEAVISPSSEKNDITSNIHRADPKVIDLLQGICVNTLCFSNNHINEHGNQAFTFCKTTLEEKGFNCLGIENEKLKIITLNNKKFGFLNYSLIDDYLENVLYCRRNIKDYNKIYDDINEASKKTDFLTVVFHWGKEFVSFPSSNQKDLAKNCIDIGADAVVGHHAHVIQGYEIYRDKNIIYGLGNFIFDMGYIKKTRQSIISEFDINQNGEVNVTIHLLTANPKSFEVEIERSFRLSENSPFHFSKITPSSELQDKIAKKEIRKAQSQIYSYFIRNLFRLPAKLVLYHLNQFISRRLR